jgi:COP9 signalosome complex subunit 1
LYHVYLLCLSLADLFTYASRYTGNTLIKRLTFVGERCGELAAEAFKLALQEVKQGVNTQAYQRLQELTGARAGTAAAADAASSDLPDQAWADQTDRQARHTQERLETELNAQKSIYSKDAIGRGYTEIGHFLLRRGDPVGALRCYTRARDYCGSGVDLMHMCANAARAALEAENYAQAGSYASRAQHARDAANLPAIPALAATAGLVNLCQGVSAQLVSNDISAYYELWCVKRVESVVRHVSMM